MCDIKAPSSRMRELFNRYKKAPLRVLLFGVERAKGIEPSSQAWEARILPMNYARMMYILYHTIIYTFKWSLFIYSIPIVVAVLC